MLVGAAAQKMQTQATIEGNADSITMSVPGATLTFANKNADDNSTWKTTYVASTLLVESVEAAVSENAKSLLTKEYFDEEVKTLAHESDVRLIQARAAIYLTSASLSSDECNLKNYTNFHGSAKCGSGDHDIVASFHGFGIFDVEGLYSCVVLVNGEETVVEATTYTMYSALNQPERGVVECVLPAAASNAGVEFMMNVSVREGVTDVPSADWNPLIIFENQKPFIKDTGAQMLIPVSGPASVLANGNTVEVPLQFGDLYDDNIDLKAEFVSLSTNQVADTDSSFVLNKTSQVLKITLEKSWLAGFLQKPEYDANGDFTVQAISFQMSVTDSSKATTVKTLSFNLSLAYSWNQNGNNDQMSIAAMTMVNTRLGKPLVTMEMCYSVARDGLSAATFHSNCEKKGKLVMLQKRRGSDRIFGAYNHVGVEPLGACQSFYGPGGDVAPGQSATDRGWMFRVMDANPNVAEFAYRKEGGNVVSYFMCTRSKYLMTWGSGRDSYCTETYCSNRFGYSYAASDGTVDPYWPSGIYGYSPRTSLDYYEVYVVPE